MKQRRLAFQGSIEKSLIINDLQALIFFTILGAQELFRTIVVGIRQLKLKVVIFNVVYKLFLEKFVPQIDE